MAKHVSWAWHLPSFMEGLRAAFGLPFAAPSNILTLEVALRLRLLSWPTVFTALSWQHVIWPGRPFIPLNTNSPTEVVSHLWLPSTCVWHYPMLWLSRKGTLSRCYLYPSWGFLSIDNTPRYGIIAFNLLRVAYNFAPRWYILSSLLNKTPTLSQHAYTYPNTPTFSSEHSLFPYAISRLLYNSHFLPTIPFSAHYLHLL